MLQLSPPPPPVIFHYQVSSKGSPSSRSSHPDHFTNSSPHLYFFSLTVFVVPHWKSTHGSFLSWYQCTCLVSKFHVHCSVLLQHLNFFHANRGVVQVTQVVSLHVDDPPQTWMSRVRLLKLVFWFLSLDINELRLCWIAPLKLMDNKGLRDFCNGKSNPTELALN